jgi:hypothetical protein
MDICMYIVPNGHKLYQHFHFQGPPKYTQNWYFLVFKKPSGMPVRDRVNDGHRVQVLFWGVPLAVHNKLFPCRTVLYDTMRSKLGSIPTMSHGFVQCGVQHHVC